MSKKSVFLAVGCSVLAIIGLFFAICAGAKTISIQTIYDSIMHFDPDNIDMQVIRNSRLPRALSTALVGGFLGVSGALMQGVTRNSLAEPSLMGISQGATLAVACLFVSPTVFGMFGTTVAAFIGATISGLLVLLFSMKNARSLNMTRLLLAGTALSTFFLSLASIIALVNNRSQNLAFWVSGGFRGTTWTGVMTALVIGAIFVTLSILLSKKINIVSLGEDVAIGLGENPTRVRIATILVLIPMSAVSVAIAGNIAFVGLIVPHIVRKLIGVDYRQIVPLSFLFGATLLIWSDIAARLANAPYETPIGLFTSFIGVPLFLYMIRKERV
ncbi:MAG: iron ABC transporter permease [bacterium]|nr:iron ABC transporter permease [bacterium]